MSGWIFPPPEPRGLPVRGEGGLYPVRRIFCVGRNYAAHAAEMGQEVDREAPFYFTKSAAHLAPTGSTVPYPPGTRDYHHEVELVAALGAPLVRATPGEAAGAVLGCATGLDMTRRDLQGQAKAKGRPWSLAKDVEGSAIVGPLARGLPAPDARIRLTVNGEVRQDARIGEMVWDLPSLLAHLSGFYRLGPGDLVFTGTPAGVGPVVPGDTLLGEIEGLEPVALAIGPPD